MTQVISCIYRVSIFVLFCANAVGNDHGLVELRCVDAQTGVLRTRQGFMVHSIAGEMTFCTSTNGIQPFEETRDKQLIWRNMEESFSFALGPNVKIEKIEGLAFFPLPQAMQGMRGFERLKQCRFMTVNSELLLNTDADLLVDFETRIDAAPICLTQRCVAVAQLNEFFTDFAAAPWLPESSCGAAAFQVDKDGTRMLVGFVYRALGSDYFHLKPIPNRLIHGEVRKYASHQERPLLRVRDESVVFVNIDNNLLLIMTTELARALNEDDCIVCEGPGSPLLVSQVVLGKSPFTHGIFGLSFAMVDKSRLSHQSIELLDSAAYRGHDIVSLGSDCDWNAQKLRLRQCEAVVSSDNQLRLLEAQRKVVISAQITGLPLNELEITSWPPVRIQSNACIETVGTEADPRLVGFAMPGRTRLSSRFLPASVVLRNFVSLATEPVAYANPTVNVHSTRKDAVSVLLHIGDVAQGLAGSFYQAVVLKDERSRLIVVSHISAAEALEEASVVQVLGFQNSMMPLLKIDVQGSEIHWKTIGDQVVSSSLGVAKLSREDVIALDRFVEGDYPPESPTIQRGEKIWIRDFSSIPITFEGTLLSTAIPLKPFNSTVCLCCTANSKRAGLPVFVKRGDQFVLLGFTSEHQVRDEAAVDLLQLVELL